MKENSLYASLLVEDADEAGLIDAWLDERLTDLAHRRVKIPDDIASTGLDEKRLAESKGSYPDFPRSKRKPAFCAGFRTLS